MSRLSRLVLWCLLALALIGGISQVRIDADLSRFVFAGQPEWQFELAMALQRGPAGRTVLIAVAAPSSKEAANASRSMVEKLGATGHFAGLHNGDATLLTAEVEALVNYRYLLSDRVGPQTFSESHLRTSLLQAEAMLADARSWAVTQLLPIDPTLETLHLAEQWTAAARLPMQHGVWFTRDGAEALIIGTTRALGDDANAQQAVEAAIRQAASAGAEAQGVRVRFTGLGLLAAEARRVTRQRVEWLGFASGALVTFILCLGYRRLLPALLSLLPVVLGLAAGLAATQWVFGDVNVLALAFACILVGEASDYASYLLTQTRPGRAFGAEAARITPTLRLAVLTSAAAFAILMLAQFRGLQQLGLLCSVGILVAGAAARWLVPELLDPQATASWKLPAIAQRAARFLEGRSQTRAARRGLQLAATLGALALLLLAKPLWDDGVASINPLPAARVAADRDLRRDAGLPLDQSMLLFVSAQPEEILRAQEVWLAALRTLQSQGSIENFDLAARYLPSRQLQQQRLQALPDSEALAARLTRAAAGTAFNVEAFQPFLDSAEKARAQWLIVDELPDALLRQRIDTLLVGLKNMAVGLAPISGVASRDELIASAQQAVSGRAVTVDWFEPRAGLSDLLAAVRERLTWLLLACVATVFAVVALGSRSLATGWRVVLPVVLALVLTAAVVRLAFGPLTAFHLVALLLVLGLSTNYSLFIDSPQSSEEVGDEQGHKVFSLAMASATTFAVFGALALSGIAVVEAVGKTVSAGILFALAWLLVEARRRSVDASTGTAR